MAELFFRETRAVLICTAFSGAPCLKLSVNGYSECATFRLKTRHVAGFFVGDQFTGTDGVP